MLGTGWVTYHVRNATTLYAECSIVHTCSVFAESIGAGLVETRLDNIHALATMMTMTTITTNEENFRSLLTAYAPGQVESAAPIHSRICSQSYAALYFKY